MLQFSIVGTFVGPYAQAERQQPAQPFFAAAFDTLELEILWPLCGLVHTTLYGEGTS